WNVMSAKLMGCIDPASGYTITGLFAGSGSGAPEKRPDTEAGSEGSRKQRRARASHGSHSGGSEGIWSTLGRRGPPPAAPVIAPVPAVPLPPPTEGAREPRGWRRGLQASERAPAVHTT